MPARLMIAAPSGRCGKTTITAGICLSLRKRGLVVQPFKKGPDYIDPSWLSSASQRQCRNLDLFMMRKDRVLKSFYAYAKDADIAIIEANMGFYDGINTDGSDSPASLARLLNIPVILVINCSRMTRSVAALLKGYMEFESDSYIKGVILNHVSGSRHEKKLTESIKKHCGIPVIGVVPRSPLLNIEERHLGLIHFKEDGSAEQVLSRLSDFMENHINIDGLLSIAKGAQDIRPFKIARSVKKTTKAKKRIKIGVFYDKAFSFYYPENLEALESEGAEIVFIDSMKDVLPHDIDGLYIGGGFPEIYCDAIARNQLLLKQLEQAIENFMPVYSECGGLMYLSKGIKKAGRIFEMVGIIPSLVEIKSKPQGHGYVVAEVIKENPFFKKQTVIKGHEFHYSTLTDTKGLNFALKVKRGYGIDGKFDGIVYKNMFASYMHIHALSVLGWAKNFVKAAKEYKNRCFYTDVFQKKGVYSHVR